MSLRAIAYTSELSPDRSRAHVQALTDAAAAFNLSAGITGVLLFDGTRFLQYIEGPDEGLDAAYARIRGATSHHSLMELGRARIGRRHFPDWSMHLLPADPEQLRTAIRNDWSGFVNRRSVPGERIYGVEGLVRLVEAHSGDAALMGT